MAGHSERLIIIIIIIIIFSLFLLFWPTLEANFKEKKGKNAANSFLFDIVSPLDLAIRGYYQLIEQKLYAAFKEIEGNDIKCYE